MFEKFTERANQVVLLAQEEARQLGHKHIGSEHLLLGLLEEGDGLAARVLQDAGLESATVRSLLPHDAPLPASNGQTPFTPRAKAVLVESLRQALYLSQNYISTEHILLALLQDRESAAGTVLREMHIDPDQMREDILALFEEEDEAPPVWGGIATEEEEREGRERGRNMLDTFAMSLTEKARCGDLDPVIGRKKEVERLIQILSRRTKNNPVLVGPPGVGKTAIIEGLAQEIVEGRAGRSLQDYEIYSLDLASLVAGSRYRGEFEERLKKLLREINKRKRIILFIDEIHSLVGAGAAEGALDAASIMKPMLARGELRVIGATTDNEFRKYFEKDGAMERRFQQIRVDEPDPDETLQILEGVIENYSSYHGIRISKEALEAAVRLSDRYITERQLPDKAIDLLDEAASRKKVRAQFEADTSTEAKVEAIRAAKNEAIEAEDYDRAASLRQEEKDLREAPVDLQEVPPLGAEDIAEIVAMWTGIPASSVSEEESKRLVRMEEALQQRIIGQTEAVSSVSRALRRSRAGISDGRRPAGSFLFLGPTGVGKTELARQLAEFLFQDREAMVRIDMSEYMEKYSVSKLLGAPPGYVGHGEGGQLTEAVRRKPYSIVLLDEIEKAHPEVFNVLLQVLDDGHLTDSEGRKVDFRQTIIIMTSNIGAQEIAKPTSFGFGGEEGWSKKELQSSVQGALRKAFRPEFLNRIDETVVFDRLGKKELRGIVDLLLADVGKRLAEKGIDVHFTSGAKSFLMQEGFDPALGARPLRRAVQTYVEDPIADHILSQGQKGFPAGTVIQVQKSRGKKGLETQVLRGGKRQSANAPS